MLSCNTRYIITSVNVELNISDNKLTKNISGRQGCARIMCTDILIISMTREND